METRYLESKADILQWCNIRESQDWDKSVHFYYDLNSSFSSILEDLTYRFWLLWDWILPLGSLFWPAPCLKIWKIIEPLKKLEVSPEKSLLWVSLEKSSMMRPVLLNVTWGPEESGNSRLCNPRGSLSRSQGPPLTYPALQALEFAVSALVNAGS